MWCLGPKMSSISGITFYTLPLWLIEPCRKWAENESEKCDSYYCCYFSVHCKKGKKKKHLKNECCANLELEELEGLRRRFCIRCTTWDQSAKRPLDTRHVNVFTNRKRSTEQMNKPALLIITDKHLFPLSPVQLPPLPVIFGASFSSPSHFRRGPLSRRAWHCG